MDDPVLSPVLSLVPFSSESVISGVGLGHNCWARLQKAQQVMQQTFATFYKFKFLFKSTWHISFLLCMFSIKNLRIPFATPSSLYFQAFAHAAAVVFNVNPGDWGLCRANIGSSAALDVLTVIGQLN